MDAFDELIPADALKRLVSGGSSGNSIRDNLIIVARYVHMSKEKEPKSVVEMVQAIEPVLNALDALFLLKKHLFSTSSSSTFIAKLDKLKTKVQDYNSMKISDQRAFTPDSLFKLQQIWMSQAAELHAMIPVA